MAFFTSVNLRTILLISPENSSSILIGIAESYRFGVCDFKCKSDAMSILLLVFIFLGTKFQEVEFLC